MAHREAARRPRHAAARGRFALHEALTVEQSGGIATFTITRPRVNALSLDLLESFSEELQRAAQDPEILVAVWRSGLPDIFSAGFDLRDEGPPGPSPAHHMPGERTARVRDAQTALLKIPIPIVVAVNGPAVGLGLLMPALCDIVVAGKSARFGLPEIQIGAIGGAGHARRILPEPVLRYMMLTGRRVPPEYLQQCGAIALVVEDEELEAETTAIAKEIASYDPVVVRNQKISLEMLRGLDDVARASRE
jgi:enoyl-CoA hydratase